jgi:predicted DNA-binding helix-hairpin-helix protein
MDPIARMKMFSSYMDLEPAEEVSCAHSSPPEGIRHKDLNISQAVMPGGKRIHLLKTLLTSACERNCYYCPFRAGRDFRRATFKPEELARTFMSIHRAGAAEGIFLSSGIAGGSVRTQDQLIDTAYILRHKLNYRGYLHLKIMPGAERDQVLHSMQLADRVSVNLEGPNDHRLQMLAPKKQFFDELLRPLQWIEEIRTTFSPRGSWKNRWPSSATQFVVGAVGESDLELLSISEHLLKRLHLRRTYFSPFRPLRDTPLSQNPPESKERERRLYQSSYLLRDYGFELEELPFTPDGNLPAKMDPKLAWAQEHLRSAPVDLLKADREELLRVPGIGPKRAETILNLRRMGELHTPENLYRVGLNFSRTAPYILLGGKKPPHQLELF